MFQRNMNKIDFDKVKTVMDLKDPAHGLSVDLLLDSMNLIRLKDDQPLEQ
jgi:hypothetical protein